MFKSEAHRRKIKELENQGKVKKGTYAEFARNTPKGKLPDRVGEKTSPLHKVRGK